MPTDANEKELQPGDRVYTIDFDAFTRIYGILKVNDHPNTRAFYEWSVLYDDGDECVVLDFGQLWKENKSS